MKQFIFYIRCHRNKNSRSLFVARHFSRPCGKPSVRNDDDNVIIIF
jgi:hypothetical protein